jgi:FixJ family two-component response regulator
VAVVDVKLKDEIAFGLIDRMHDRGICVVVVSGYAVLPSSTKKAVAILQKPFSEADLLATLLHVMGQETGHR